jgi:hypothetical protein
MRIRIHYVLLFMMSIVLMMSFSSLKVYSSSGIAVTGTFADYHYKLLPGEVMESNEIFVLFFNNYDVDIEIELTTYIYNKEGTLTLVDSRVSILLDQTIVFISAMDSIRIPIGISLSSEAAAGEYQLGLSASVLPSQTDGITVTGSAELRSTLSIFGEAGDIEFYTFDIFGDALLADLKLYRRDGSSTVLLRSVQNGVIIDRLIPGDYYIVGTYKEYEVLREDFVLVDRELTRIHCIAQTLFIKDFILTPLISTTTNLLSRIRMEYTLINIHDMLEDIQLVLKASFEDVLYGEEVETTIPYLPESIFEGGFNYISPLDFEVGPYTFIIDVYIGAFDEADSIYLSSSSITNLHVLDEHVFKDPLLPEVNTLNLIDIIPVWAFVLMTVFGIVMIGRYIKSIRKII